MNWRRNVYLPRLVALACVVFFLPTLALAQASDALRRSTDYDGDGLGDIITYDSSTATFKVRKSSTGGIESVRVGYVGDRPAVGDFDGDGHGDLASFGRYDGRWQVLITNGNGAYNVKAWSGQMGDVPVPGNYDRSTGDELVTYSRRTGVWTIANASGNILATVNHGGPGKLPVPLDYDCDGYLDPAYFDQFSNRWVIRQSSDESQVMVKFGRDGDIPVPGDYDGDGCDEIAIYKPDVMVFEQLGSVTNGIGAAGVSKQWGLVGDIPVPLNVDGDYKTDYAIYRPSDGNFYINTSAGVTFVVPFISGATPMNNSNPWAWGSSSSEAPEFVGRWAYGYNRLLGDYNRDGKSDFAVASVNRSLGITTFSINSGRGVATAVIGAPGDAITPGDFDGDGITQPGVVTVRSDSILQWTHKNANGVDTVDFWGVNGDTPIVGDFDCDGRTDRAVARNENGFIYWYFLFATGQTQFSFLHGLADDRLFAADVDNDGCDELVNARLGDEGWYWFFTGLDDAVGDYDVLQWGLVDDLPMRPNDVNGDGAEDFIVARNGAQRSLMRRSSDGRFIDNPWPDYPWQEINYGLNSDISVFGNFSGDNKHRQAVFRRSGYYAPGFIYPVLGIVDISILHGTASSVLVRPDGTIVQVGEGIPGGGSGGGGGAGCTPTPGTDSDFLDGAGSGALWKPYSEGVSNGAPVMLLPISYCGASVVALGSDGTEVSGIQRTKCGGNGNRAHFWFSKTASQMTPSEPLTIKVVHNGSTECRAVPDATQRYD